MEQTPRAAESPRRRSNQLGYFFAGAFSEATVPPLSLQSFSDIITQPLPLQPFWPAQALLAEWQPLLPLQELTP